MSLRLVGSYAKVLILIGIPLLGCSRHAAPGVTEGQPSGARLFLSYPGYTQMPMQPKEYAKLLMATPDGDVYVMLILAGNKAFQEKTARPLEHEDPQLRAVMATFQNAYAVAIIEGLPENPPLATLWALTERLDDREVGRWSTSRPKDGLIAEHESAPMREVARKALVKSLHTDHGFDVAAWRQEIRQRSLGKTP